MVMNHLPIACLGHLYNLERIITMHSCVFPDVIKNRHFHCSRFLFQENKRPIKTSLVVANDKMPRTDCEIGSFKRFLTARTWRMGSQDLSVGRIGPPMYKPWSSAIWFRGPTIRSLIYIRGLTITMVMNHQGTWIILQVGMDPKSNFFQLLKWVNAILVPETSPKTGVTPSFSAKNLSRCFCDVSKPSKREHKWANPVNTHKIHGNGIFTYMNNACLLWGYGIKSLLIVPIFLLGSILIYNLLDTHMGVSQK